MAVEWPKHTVSELQQENIILVEDGNHGENRPRPYEFVDDGVAFIRAADMDNGTVLFRSASKIIAKARKRIRKGIGAPGDVLLSHKGTVGKVALVPEDAPPFVCSPQTTFWRTLRPEVLDRKYLHAFLRSPDFHQQLATRAGETDMAPYVSLTSQRGLHVVMPPIELQRAIGCILGALDDKIELNRRMHKTLEAMARTIFKSWFVDFDPVRVKAESGKPTVLAQNIAKLFPNLLEDSELCEIPYGWHVMPLFDIAKYVNGAAFKSTDFCDPRDGLPVVKIAELKNGITNQTKYSKRELNETQRIDTGDTLYSWSGSPDTSLDVFLWTRGPGLLNQHIFKVITKTGAQKRFAYYLLKHLRPTLIEIARNKQTTGLGHVTIADMKQLLVCRPPDPVLHAFDRIVEPLFNRCFSGEMESASIFDLRDTLLPKLISGNLQVPNAERIVERCV